ncbi:hypothetical protein BDV96DRAFT_570194 [Lophiotrema nucula]|uniref:Uncharacterized protein n=1 Tax=Lophiotrema nucula TaxID=690887 RepID=A0A6A5ZIC1_9PLEO|nr:hypothetical protein BDV96DRAFT_570194 [Lophiotrema nucula]
MPICSTCLALRNEGLRIMPCKRGQIVPSFDDEFQNLIELSESEWLLCTGKYHWKVTVDYFRLGHELALKHGIVDINNFVPQSRSPKDQIGACCAFLQQFWSTLERWPNVYEPLSLKVIANPASWQIFLLESLPDEATESPILLAYRCLIITRRLGTFAYHFPIDWLVVDHFALAKYDMLEANIQQGQGDNSPSLRPLMTLEKMPEKFRPPDDANKRSNDSTLPDMLNRTVESARVKLLSGDPKEWVTVFWVLCLLLLIHFDLEEVSGFTDTLLNAQHKLWDAIEMLAGLYLHCCGDLHPLNKDGLDKEWFSLLTGLEDDCHKLDDFFSCNDIWIAEYEEDDHTGVRNYVKHFIKHLDNFVHGWTRL